MMKRGARSKSDVFNPKAKSASEAMDLLVLANRILSNEGIMDYLGHVSVRNPENPQTFFISRSLAPEQVTRHDLLEVDFEGRIVTRTTAKPYSERIIHGAIYKARPDVHSVIHAHPHPFELFVFIPNALLLIRAVPPIPQGQDFRQSWPRLTAAFCRNSLEAVEGLNRLACRLTFP